MQVSKQKSTLDNSFTSQVSQQSSQQTQRRPPLTSLKFNEINTTPQKELINLDKNEKKSDLKQQKNQQQNSNPQTFSSNKKPQKKQIIETDLVIQEFEKLKLKTLQKIQKNQITQVGTDPRALRDQIYEQIFLLVSENLKQSKIIDSKKLGYDCSCQKDQNNSINDISLSISNFSSVANVPDHLQISQIFEDSNKEQQYQQEISKLQEENSLLFRQKELEFILSQNMIQQMKKQAVTSSLDYQLQLQQQDILMKKITQQISQSNSQSYSQYIDDIFDKNVPVNTNNYFQQKKQSNNDNLECQKEEKSISQQNKNVSSQLQQQNQKASRSSSQNGSPNSNIQVKQQIDGNHLEQIIEQHEIEINKFVQEIREGLSELLNINFTRNAEFDFKCSIQELLNKQDYQEKLQQQQQIAWRQLKSVFQKQQIDTTFSTWDTRKSCDSSQIEGSMCRDKIQTQQKLYENQNYLQSQDQQQKSLESEVQIRLNDIYHKENALKRRLALLKKKELCLSQNQKKLQTRLSQFQQESKLLEEKQKIQMNNEQQLNQLWQDFFKEAERIFQQIYQPSNENNTTQQAIISIQKVQNMVQGYISKTNKDKQILEKERDMVKQIRRDLEAKEKELQLEKLEFDLLSQKGNQYNDIQSKYSSIQQ
ncbi:hypothetical protein TTHERM_00294850 (macronuclear) [Tetrahymena thermophila SB210]|uniref:Uncharacterized protein n=1 Tax=Tetrahymena thermophila (strain SB210) TaxID=312017 RepID=I7MDW9_TETTS|nr:hypothetical protein TTHERM_00294850 [Tetrahymena thermophila SB210]EAR92872.2 hypothetical protein TTHERM_00294850 [Tetrahymena thermophila SB210]|eukprot:XP_001013117.2 hypothetical protein TTHERM_00294850 [Tetrahymena thermophila SB210]